jgi:phosphomevalonate kinase
VERVEHTWSNYKELDVSPLTAVESMAKGSRIEKIDGVPGLRSATSPQ